MGKLAWSVLWTAFVVVLVNAAPEKYAQQPSDAEEDFLSAGFDCSGKSNGAYGVGCSRDYWLCWEGTAAAQWCPEQFKFNDENGQCDYPQNVFACSGVRVTTTFSSDAATLPPVDFDCAGLEDGDYSFAESCQETYVSCVAGTAYQRDCPAGLSFDYINRICDRLENIVACGGSLPTEAAPVEISYECPEPYGSFALPTQLCSATYYICDNTVASIAMCPDPTIWDDSNKQCRLPTEISECAYDCAGKADGSYSEGCSQTYWWCWAERATKLSCPETLIFNGENGQCDFRDNIFQCTGVRNAPTETLTDHVTPPPVDFDCSNMHDGNYAFTSGDLCQQKFVSCSGGVAWELVCPSGLLFDPDQLSCERPERIIACGGSPAEPTTTHVYQPVTRPAHYTEGSYSRTTPFVQPVTRRQPKPITRPYTTTPAAAPTETLADFEYIDYETTPRSFNQRKTTTPAAEPRTDTYYDYSTGTYQPYKPTIAPNPAPTRRSSFRPTPAETIPEEPEDDADLCDGQPDGTEIAVSESCYDVYARCSNGKSLLRFCPKNQVFSVGRGCDFRTNLPECQSTDSSLLPKEEPTISPPNFCTGKPDGDYPTGNCLNMFISCWKNILTERSCTDGHVFDPRTRVCEQAAWVESCPKSRTTTTTTELPDEPTTDAPTGFDSYYGDDQGSDSGNREFSGFNKNNNPYGDSFPINPTASDSVINRYEQPINNEPTQVTYTYTRPFVRDTPAAAQDYYGGATADGSRSNGPCSGRQNFEKVALGDCNDEFILCKDGREVRKWCPSGTVFDSSSLNCALVQSIPACAPTTVAGPCTGRDGDRFAVGECSDEFIFCKYDKAVRKWCPAGTIFDSTILNCAPLASVPACAPTPPPSRCAGRDGDRIALGDCNDEFIVCKYGKELHKWCPDGTVFDSNSRTCAYRCVLEACAEPEPSYATPTAAYGNGYYRRDYPIGGCGIGFDPFARGCDRRGYRRGFRAPFRRHFRHRFGHRFGHGRRRFHHGFGHRRFHHGHRRHFPRFGFRRHHHHRRPDSYRYGDNYGDNYNVRYENNYNSGYNSDPYALGKSGKQRSSVNYRTQERSSKTYNSAPSYGGRRSDYSSAPGGYNAGRKESGAPVWPSQGPSYGSSYGSRSSSRQDPFDSAYSYDAERTATDFKGEEDSFPSDNTDGSEYYDGDDDFAVGSSRQDSVKGAYASAHRGEADDEDTREQYVDSEDSSATNGTTTYQSEKKENATFSCQGRPEGDYEYKKCSSLYAHCDANGKFEALFCEQSTLSYDETTKTCISKPECADADADDKSDPEYYLEHDDQFSLGLDDVEHEDDAWAVNDLAANNTAIDRGNSTTRNKRAAAAGHGHHNRHHHRHHHHRRHRHHRPRFYHRRYHRYHHDGPYDPFFNGELSYGDYGDSSYSGGASYGSDSGAPVWPSSPPASSYGSSGYGNNYNRGYESSRSYGSRYSGSYGASDSGSSGYGSSYGGSPKARGGYGASDSGSSSGYGASYGASDSGSSSSGYGASDSGSSGGYGASYSGSSKASSGYGSSYGGSSKARDSDSSSGYGASYGASGSSSRYGASGSYGRSNSGGYGNGYEGRGYGDSYGSDFEVYGRRRHHRGRYHRRHYRPRYHRRRTNDPFYSGSSYGRSYGRSYNYRRSDSYGSPPVWPSSPPVYSKTPGYTDSYGAAAYGNRRYRRSSGFLGDHRRHHHHHRRHHRHHRRGGFGYDPFISGGGFEAPYYRREYSSAGYGSDYDSEAYGGNDYGAQSSYGGNDYGAQSSYEGNDYGAQSSYGGNDYGAQSSYGGNDYGAKSYGSSPVSAEATEACAGKQNGYLHPLGHCTRDYCVCYNGKPYQQQCLEGHVFEKQYDRCVPLAQSPTCTPQPTTTPAYVPPAEFNPCIDKPNNFYHAIGHCTRDFCICYNGKPYQQQCAEGDVFEPEYNRCVSLGNSPTCSPKTVAPPTYAPAEIEACAGQPDGSLHAMGVCSRDYCVCYRGKPYQQQCYEGDVFMPKCGRCLRAKLVPSCNPDRDIPSSSYGSYGSSASDVSNAGYGQRDRGSTGSGYGSVGSDASGTGYNQIGSDASGSSYNPTSSDVSGSGSNGYGSVGSDASGSGYNHLSSDASTFGGYNPTVSDVSGSDYNRPSDSRSVRFEDRYGSPTASDAGSGGYNSVGNDFGSDRYRPAASDTQSNLYNQRPADVPRTTTPYFFPFGRLTTVAPPNDVTVVDERCRGIPEGDTRSVGRCRQDYIECRLGQAIIRYCDGQQVFDSAMRVCAASDSIPQCSSTKSRSDYSGGAYDGSSASPASLSAACKTRGDGYYRHPTDCQRFVQCFHGNSFVLNCASGLVFNANKDAGVCDYPVNVPECQNVAGDASAQDAECVNRPEGAFFRDQTDCMVFYRCVRGQKLKFDCPATTVFNERLNVCDWPSAVPECNSS